MKNNIHILPTDKPSRLHLWFNKLELSKEFLEVKSNKQNIYITSYEEIKEGDWFIYKNEIIHRDKGDVDSMWVEAIKNGKKIILTTDVDLIKNGVQAIDDEFLEWFVKNPSYKEVKVIKHLVWEEYKIIIPREEQKKETLEEAFEKWDDQQSKKGVGYDKFDVLRFGYKLAQERSYSEEDMKKAWEDGREGTKTIGIYPFYQTIYKNQTFEEWFEEFKNK